ncbi:MAG: hypothetical protein IRY83_11550 [Chloroflexi bacterium]|nr:hypothetical protein [Chloroflexota bacterium]
MGVTLLTQFAQNVRTDLKDLDPASQLWSDAELVRHIQHALDDYQAILPLSAAVTLTAAAAPDGSTRRQVLNPRPDGYLWTERVELAAPDGTPREPRRGIAFREEPAGQGVLYLGGDALPSAGDLLLVWYAKAHTLDTSVSTVPTEHEEIIALGAVAYAARAAARYAAGRLNVSAWTPRGLADFARERMAAYLAALAALRAAYGSAGPPGPRW